MRRLLALVAAMTTLAATSADAGDVGDAQRIRMAVDHLISTQLENGLFRYDFDFLSGEPSGKDNLVRQAGTLFALGEYRLDTGDERLDEVLRKGIAHMASLSVPVGRGTLQSLLESAGLLSVQSWRWERMLDEAGLLYDPDGSEGKLVANEYADYTTAWAGTTALVLLAELHYFRATGDDRFAEIRSDWVRGLGFLHVPGRGIREHPATLTESPYFNGETWLALAYYHETFPDDEAVAERVAALDDYLLDLYGNEPTNYFFHWGSMTSEVRHRTTGDARFARFVARFTPWYLDQTPAERTKGHTTCSMIEGLASVYGVLAPLGGREELVARVRKRAHLELERNRAMQLQPGQDRLEMGGGGVFTSPTLASQPGAFLAGPHRLFTRNDLNQHCVSALLKARRVGLADDLP